MLESYKILRETLHSKSILKLKSITLSRRTVQIYFPEKNARTSVENT